MLNIAFVGALYNPKGLQTIYRLTSDKSLLVNWFSIGWITSDYIEPLVNVEVYGPYKSRLELYDFLDINNIDLVILPNECPETFSYVMSEIWEYGLPILGTDRGAIESRISESQCGWVCNPLNMEVMIKYLINNRNELYKMYSIVEHYKVPSIDTMYKCYMEIYDNCISCNV